MKFQIREGTPVKPQNRHWQFCVGSGHAPLALRTDYVKQLKFIHDELGIERVRFHGIFNDDMHVITSLEQILPVKPEKPVLERSFRNIGLAYDNVLAAGMKPFVELSFMPEFLGSGDAKCSFFYKGNITPPGREEAWMDFIRDFIRYLIRRYGRKELESWYFEVWNEPDLPVFWSGTQEQYFRLYEITVRAIKSVDDKIPVGGPATSASRWVKSFVEYCNVHEVPVDFVSTHQYAGDPIGILDENNDGSVKEKKKMQNAPGLSLDFSQVSSVLEAHRLAIPDQSETREIPYGVFRDDAAIVKKQAGGLPVIYTEWNENAIFTAYTNDTRKAAAYDIRSILEVEDFVDASSIWCFSDIFEEFHNYPQEFHGGFGMLTNNGIPKPLFYALRMMRRTADMRYELPGATEGEIGLAAFKGNGETQILLFRQKLKNLTLPRETAEIELELKAAPQNVILQRIDETHGNPLALWEEMGRPQDLTPAEIKEIIRQSEVKDEPMEYSYEDGILRTEAALGVNDVYFIRIIHGM